ncbi:DUF4132 domain-containing protein [Actinomadura barringtoniae]|uniref:DUF4132 domain-containing protein n=1 Tax=Actinomadura barringtoniae TaxID=1427535 RepID=A0A939T6B6_9ACTN|nr:DUF4132 domain-containing protein [Actinomadura barringtoniae]MBO2450639.1 DUF4132 domain-containing protein [Actinomadura barringtoniae]
MDAPHISAPEGEDALVLPAAWLRRLHPRHGGIPVAGIKLDRSAPETVAELVRASERLLEGVFACGGSAPELVEAARRHLGGEPDPLGAAVVTDISRSQRRDANHEPGLDAWVVEHGLAFAACAFVELATFTVNIDSRRDDYLALRFWNGDTPRHPWWTQQRLARRMRTLVAAASDAEYEEIEARLAEHRTTRQRRIVASYLVPARQDWADECSGEPPTEYFERPLQWMLRCALGSSRLLDRLDRLGHQIRLDWADDSNLDVIATMTEGLGPALIPVLIEALDSDRGSNDHNKERAEALAVLPTDEAFEALVARVDRAYVPPVLLEAMRRFPVRALRLLSAASAAATPTSKSGKTITELLTGHVLANAELTAAMLPNLPDEARAVVERIAEDNVRVEAAPADALPPLLLDAPWTRKRSAAKPVVIADLPAPSDPAIVWAPGEREKWADDTTGEYWSPVPGVDWVKEVQDFREGKLKYWSNEVSLFVGGPEELVRPLLAAWRPRAQWDASAWMKPIIARFEFEALPQALLAAETNASSNAALLVPFADEQVAGLMAGYLARHKSARPAAIAWLTRHEVHAARLLIPVALGKAGRARRDAEGALFLLAGKLGPQPIVDAAREHGDKAATAIEALLATDPLEQLPAKIPAVGEWADPAVLPQVLLREGGQALPDAAAAHLITMLAMSKPGDVYAGLDVVGDLATPESLADFSWGLFQRWQASGGPSKESWAMTQLGWLGDDETVRRLTPLIRAWPGEGGHKKAVNGLEILAEIGTDVALMHLHGIAQKVKFKGLKTKAQEKIDQVAADLGLTPERLADRLVPDFGLEVDGTLTLDYGPRRFTVGFDEHLKPFVADEDGKPRKALPKPGAKDDAELAPAAYKAFSALKKDVRSVAADQVSRLENAMVSRRRWTAAEFRDLFVVHPLLWHIVRRLVWLAEDGGKTTTFRIAEDRTAADVDDEIVTVPDSAEIGIAHPLDLGADLEAWSEVFADYEILQPFPQLGRPVHALTDEEAESGRLTRFEGLTVPFGDVLALMKHGWERGVPLDAGVERWISRRVPGNRHVVIDLDPGFAVGLLTEFPEQKLDYVWLADKPNDYHPRVGTRLRFGDLDPVTASEILADLTALADVAR